VAIKPDYFYHQSGVVPYRIRKGELEVLLVTARYKRNWIIPKGIIEPDFSARNSAAKEALEEAGVIGAVGSKPLGVYKQRKWGRACSIKVYPMLVTHVYKVWKEDDRKRQWLPLKKALKLVGNDGLKRVMEQLPELV
jgi:phosphohistidine phosphatase